MSATWLCWSVVIYGQVTRFVQAPNAPTAQRMLHPGEKLVGPGRPLFQVPAWHREYGVQRYEHADEQ